MPARHELAGEMRNDELRPAIGGWRYGDEGRRDEGDAHKTDIGTPIETTRGAERWPLTAECMSRRVVHSQNGADRRMSKITEISRSFKDVRHSADSFVDVPTGSAQRRRTVSLTAHLGATAVPLLCRQLVAGDDARSAWAYFLLSRAGG